MFLQSKKSKVIDRILVLYFQTNNASNQAKVAFSGFSCLLFLCGCKTSVCIQERENLGIKRRPFETLFSDIK